MRLAVPVLAALLAAAAVFVWRSYTSDLRAARARVDGGGTVIGTRCGPIEYAAAGSGMPVLMIHGAGGGFDQGLAFAAPLQRRGLRIIAPSRFGYLRTPAPADASPQAQADAHACLLDALGLESVAVLGGSAGAPSAMQLCIRHPQRCRSLVLVVPAAYAPAHAGQTMKVPTGLQTVATHVLTSDPVLWAMTRLWPAALLRTMLATPIEDFENAGATEQARALRILENVQPVSRRVAGLAIDARITASLPRYALERIDTPTLLVSVENDLFGTWENARFTAAQIEGARFVSYPDGGHIWLGHDAEVWHEIAGFVAANGPSVAPAMPP